MKYFLTVTSFCPHNFKWIIVYIFFSIKWVKKLPKRVMFNYKCLYGDFTVGVQFLIVEIGGK